MSSENGLFTDCTFSSWDFLWTTYSRTRNSAFATYCQHCLLTMPSQAFEASFVAYLHVASLSVSVSDIYFHFQTLWLILRLFDDDRSCSGT